MKYLLYIDILGFREMVRTRPKLIDRVYRIVDSLNVHRHHAFQTTVFSDTIIAYNAEDPVTKHDHSYFVMYSCEFAKDLLYRFAGHGLYFRAYLTYGEFTRYHLKHTDCFYGGALIRAYDTEKTIECHGMFIDQHCKEANNIFPVAAHCSGQYYVYLNQSIDSFLEEWGGVSSLPINDSGFSDSDTPYFLAKDVLMLRDIYRAMRESADPGVRAKHLCAWDYYRRRYQEFVDFLERHSFSLSSISSSHAWPEEDKIREEI